MHLLQRTVMEWDDDIPVRIRLERREVEGCDTKVLRVAAAKLAMTGDIRAGHPGGSAAKEE